MNNNLQIIYSTEMKIMIMILFIQKYKTRNKNQLPIHEGEKAKGKDRMNLISHLTENIYTKSLVTKYGDQSR